MTATKRYSAAASRSLTDDSTRRLVASYTGRYAAVIPDFKMQPGMLYTQVRAISARINQNYDAWPSEELKKSFRTFLGKPVFVNHQNFDPEKARGRVVAARYRESGRDKYIEVIQEIDAVRFPKLAKEIHEGGLDSVSMGVEAGFTKCSVCDNKATDISDMCDHVKHHKGETLRHAKTGEPTLVYENCYKLGFFELSYVFDPADETAVVSRVVVANKKNAVADYIPTREELALADAKAKKRKNKPSWVQQHADDALNSLELDRKVRKLREFLKSQDDFLPHVASLRLADLASQIDWADLGRQAAESGGPANPDENPDVAEIIQTVSPEEADFIRSRYSQGYSMAKSRTAAATDDEQNKTMSTMQDMTPGDMAGMPSAPTQYDISVPQIGGGGSSSGGLGGAGTPSSGGQPDASNILPNSRGLYDTLMQKFPGSDIGGYRVDNYHEHDRGALDFMTTDPAQAAQVRQEAFSAGAPYVLWQQRQWNSDGTSSPMENRGSPTQNHYDHVHIAPFTPKAPTQGAPMKTSRRHRLAWGETEAPEDIDTLRDESEDDGSDDFHHYVQSPDELKTPDFDQAKRLDRAQEDAGLDADRRVEDVEEVGIPTRKGGSTMPRYRYAEDMGGQPMDPSMMGGAPPMDPSQGGAPMDPSMGGGQPAMDPNLGQMGPDQELALLNQAQGDLAYAESELYGMPGGDPSMGGGAPDIDMGAGGQPYEDTAGEPDGDYDEDDEPAEDEGEEDEESADPTSIPPQIEARRRIARDTEREYLAFCKQARLDPTNPSSLDHFIQGMSGPVRNTASQKKVRRTQKGRSMGINLSERGRVASRGRRLHADESGHVDGGPYGRNDQGEQEEIFLSQTPAEEALVNPTVGDSISNTENTLVARVQRGTEQLRRDAAALAKLRQQKAAAMRKRADDNIIEPTTVNPDLSGTDDQSLKGDDFDSIALDNVATQPKDASIHAFAAFDDWLARSTGKTARQHGNANFIRREAARYIRATGVPLSNLFPTLEKVLVEARKAETTKEANMKRRANESLETAAPMARADVEAPVSGVTDADAQASQYALSDYGNNASDNLADPDLSTDSQFWAPGGGEKTSNRTADAVAAVRCAEAYINAGLAPASEKWKLIARFQTMRHATVVDRTRLLEAKNDVDRSAANRQRSAAVSRGTSIPRGLGSGQRTAQTNRVAANDPSSDSLLFFK